MKISEAIKKLKIILKEAGDLEITTVTDITEFDEETGFLAEFDKVIEVINFPNDQGEDIKVVAFIDNIEWIPSSPEPEPTTRKFMTLVK